MGELGVAIPLHKTLKAVNPSSTLTQNHLLVGTVVKSTRSITVKNSKVRICLSMSFP